MTYDMMYNEFYQKIECCASGETTLDNCRCCPVCTKTDQETCGGHWGEAGECASGLNCLKKIGLYIEITLNFSSIFF